MPFSPDMADELAAGVVDVYAETERLLLARIAHFVGKGIDTPDYVERRLLETQLLQRQAGADLIAGNTTATAQLAAQLSRAWSRGSQQAESDIVRSVLGGIRAATGQRYRLDAIVDDATNSLRSAADRIFRAIPDEYRAVIRKAAPQALTGVLTRRQASQQALDELADKGITAYVDSRGRQLGVDTYVEMATRTAVGRAAVEGHVNRLVGRGFSLVMVSDAPQECELCRPFEGKVFSIGDGVAPEGVTVLMPLDEARARGLFHPNCRHVTSLYQPGITRLPENTADPVGDKARQRLRYLERQVRAARRREAVALTPEAVVKARRDARKYQARIREHVATTPAKRQPHRERLTRAKPVQRDPFGRKTDEELQDQLMGEFEKGAPDEALVERISVEMELREKYAGSDISEHYRRRNTVLDEGFGEQSDEEIAQLIEEATASGDPSADEFVHEAQEELRNRAYSGKGFSRAVARRAVTPRSESKAARLRRARQEYDLYLQDQRVQLENATNGNYVRRDRLAEWNAKHGGRSQLTMMLEGDPTTVYRYASREVRDYFENNPRLTFAEYAIQAGISDPVLEERAEKARRRARDAAMRAEERRR